MLSLKTIHKLFGFIALFLTLTSFSGYVNYDSCFEKTPVELVTQKSQFDLETINYCEVHSYKSQQVYFNQYTVFSFRSLLKSFNFNVLITLKSQGEAELQFRNFNSILERNLIAQTQQPLGQDILE
jgi:hypothetical protein